MKARSFQLKLALWSALLSGVVLAGFGWFFLQAIYRGGLERIDREILALGETRLRSRPHENQGADFERSLHFVYGDRSRRGIVLKALDGRGNEIYTSPTWPTEVDSSNLDLPTFLAEPPPQRNGPGLPRRPPRQERAPWLEDGPMPSGRPPPPNMRDPVFLTRKAQDESWRFGLMGHDRMTVVIGMDLADLRAENAHYRNIFLLSAPLALICLAGAGWILARRALRPVTILTRTAESITARELGARIPATRSDREFEELIAVINGMLERLDRSFQQAARFSADAAHELKTPLTILQGRLEQAVQEAPEASEQQRMLTDLLDEVQRLKSVTRKLLLLSQADSGRIRLHVEPIALSEKVRSLESDARALGPELAISSDIEPDIVVEADAELFDQVLINLLSNAIKFNQPSGAVHFHLRQCGDAVELAVSNTARDLTPEDRERIFERFYRGDPSRNRRIDGSGLGLSLAREIVREHGGALEVRTEKPGWVTFAVTLPRSSTG